MGLTTNKSKQLASLQREMDNASNYADWAVLADIHDQCSCAAIWRDTDQTSLYDFTSIRSRLDKLQTLRLNKDDHGLIFALNEGIHGNMGGMGKPVLYTRAKGGTKRLIENYVQTISESLTYLANISEEIIPFEEKFEFFRRASHCYGRSALMLSGGGMLGNFHLGVIKILAEEHLLPVVISGSSAGALVAAIIGTHTDDEYLDMYNNGQLFDALSEGNGKFKFSMLRREIIGINEVAEGIARLVPDMTFSESYQKTGRSINISVSPAKPQQSSRLLNHITSPNVLIRSAVMASSAIPGVFPSVTLMAKNIHGEEQPYLPSRKWTDGSFSQDLPAKRLSRMYGVNHFVVSQVNPVALPLLSDPKTATDRVFSLKKISSYATQKMLRTSLSASQKYLKLPPRVNMIFDTVHKLIDQEYTGDINIFPGFRYLSPAKIISAASLEDINFLVEEGIKATIPKIPVLKTNALIGRTLDTILLDYEHDGGHWLHTAPKTRTLTSMAEKKPASKTASSPVVTSKKSISTIR